MIKRNSRGEENIFERNDRVARLGRKLRQEETERISRALGLTKEDCTHNEPSTPTTLDRVMARRFAEALLDATAPTGGLLKAAFDYLEATEEA